MPPPIAAHYYFARLDADAHDVARISMGDVAAVDKKV
jgi:hypothetical protein